MKLTDLNPGDRFVVRDATHNRLHGIILDEPHKAYITFDSMKFSQEVDDANKDIRFVEDLQRDIDKHGDTVVKL